MNIVIAIFIAAAVALGGGYYFTANHTETATTTETGTESEQTAETTETAQPGKFSGSFMELTARGGSWKCTVDSSATQAQTSGIAYVSNGKLRADFKTAVQGYGSVESHVMSDGEDVYTWSSVMPQGIKTKVTAQGQGGAATSGQGVNADTSYSYDCQPWTADASVFVLPTSVTFKVL